MVATTEGIIGIEVKNYNGWIYSNGGHKNWTKVMAHDKKKYKFYNSIKQVSGHIQSIKTGTESIQKHTYIYNHCILWRMRIKRN